MVTRFQVNTSEYPTGKCAVCVVRNTPTPWFWRGLVLCLLGAWLVCFVPRDALCQGSCCVKPDGESIAPSGSESDTNWVGGKFVQTLVPPSTYPNISYDGSTVREVQGIPGNNGCWFPGSVVGKNPGIFGPGGMSWEVVSSNQWGPDLIGFQTVYAQQVYQQEQAGAVPDGCDTVTYQTMQINCNGTYQTYETNVEQDRFVYENQTMKACRSDVEHCVGSIQIPPTQVVC